MENKISKANFMLLFYVKMVFIFNGLYKAKMALTVFFYYFDFVLLNILRGVFCNSDPTPKKHCYQQKIFFADK